MISLLSRWRSSPGGPSDAGAFLRALESPKRSFPEKVAILNAFNDWNVLISVWFEIADKLAAVERLFEDKKFSERKSAALLISKVYFCLDEYDRSLQFALKAGDLFNLVPNSASKTDNEYVHKILEMAIDKFKRESKSSVKGNADLLELIEKIVSRNLNKGEFWYVISLGFETRNIDIVRRAFSAMKNKQSVDQRPLILQTIRIAASGCFENSFCNALIDAVIAQCTGSSSPDLLQICECLIRTDNHDEVAEIIHRLHKNNQEAMAYQIGFDLYETASMRFVQAVEKKICAKFPSPDGKSEPFLNRIRSILKGDETLRIHRNFLIKNNKTDVGILEELKELIRNATCHNALLVANGFMHYGTTNDDFLRNNLGWVGKATNWNKFNAVAALGLIHRGHTSEALRVLDSYLPKNDVAESMGYKEGGATFAYGLINMKHSNDEVTKNLSSWLKAATNPPSKHGACLGLGVANLGTGDESAYTQLREILFLDDAVAGEGASVGMGLVNAGRLDDPLFSEMRQYMIDTQHDKIQRGLRTALACASFGMKDSVEKYVAQMIDCNNSPMVRSAGVCMLSMAYAGTGNFSVVRRLLEKVAADPNNDVKRYAATALGFVLCSDIDACLEYVSILLEHFNGFVRYGAVMAIATACAGTGSQMAIAMLEPLTSDKEGFVCNGALVALALVMTQQNEYTCPKVSAFRRQLTKKMGEKNEESIVKMGAIIAHGILDVGGRNATISMLNRNRDVDMASAVGMMTWQHHWFWHSMHFMLSLAFKPSCLAIVNKDLKIPKIEFQSSANLSCFAYPLPVEAKKEKESKRVETAVLSITGKKKTKNVSKKTLADVGRLDTVVEFKSPSLPDSKGTNLMGNPARVLREQLPTMSLPQDSRYKAVVPLSHGGIVVANYNHAEPEQLIVEVASTNFQRNVSGSELSAHVTFEIDINDY